ncbi:MAG: prepilin-type N-terminal cleavage/methylation domain-containing protein [Desulforhabdus sp.]|nr:prepilin-type N-terminal cleavage/methylation domain-containing protein [Desulforhabdus sp.]
MKKITLSNDSKGFTLVEVFVAMLIFLLGLLPLLRLAVASIQGNIYAQQLTRATALAEAKMESLLVMPYQNLVDEAPIAKSTHGYTVTWTQSQIIPNTTTVSVSVSWLDKGGTTHGISMSSIKGD